MFHRRTRGDTRKLLPHSEAPPLWAAELERIHAQFARFLTSEEATNLARWVDGLAMAVDEEIGPVLQDPSIARRYEYDGQFFSHRTKHLFHTAFDGLHVLRWLSDSFIELFFARQSAEFGELRVIEESEKHLWIARTRRTNWEECGTLGIVADEVIGEAFRSRAPHPVPALSAEEVIFFQRLQSAT